MIQDAKSESVLAGWRQVLPWKVRAVFCPASCSGRLWAAQWWESLWSAQPKSK